MKRMVVYCSMVSLLLLIMGCGDDGDAEPTKIIRTDPADNGSIYTNGNLTITFNNEIADVEVNGIPADVTGTKAIWKAQGLSNGIQKLLIQWIDTNDSEGSTEITLTAKSDPTYINKKFLVKITNMPLDTWTVKKLGKDEQGVIFHSNPGFFTSNILLLMEPVAPDKPKQFIDYDEEGVGYIGNILNAGMPFIDVWVAKYDGIEIPSYELPEIIKSIYAGVELSEAKPVAGTNCTGYRITGQLDQPYSDSKITLSYFVKKDSLFLIEYIAQNTKYVTYFGVYDNIVKNLTLMGM